MIPTGLVNEIKKTVIPEHTASAVASGLLDVLSTPMLIAYMEEAALKIAEPYLEEGQSTVGISMNMKHTSATPVGMEVVVIVTLTEVDRKRLVFNITARDKAGEIATAVHERFIINSEAFMEKVQCKQ